MSLTIQEVQVGLLEAIKALGIADDVRAYPINKVRDEKFLDDVADLASRSVLLVHQSFADRLGKRVHRFSAILVFQDPKGEAEAEMAAAVERFFNELIGADILQEKLWILPDGTYANVGTNPDRAVGEIPFECTHEVEKAVTS